jgi:hypothetical protein
MAMGLILFVTFLVIFFSFVFLKMTNDVAEIKDTLIAKNKREKEDTEHFHEVIQTMLMTERKTIERINELEKRENKND